MKSAASGAVPPYKAYPALAAYIDRIGAEQLNFRRFMVKEHKGNYYYERVIITFDHELNIVCNQKEYRPTEAEAALIKSELKDAKFPHSIGARTSAPLLKKLGCAPGDLFDLYDRRTGLITMVQQRRDFADGTKAYLPYTLWSDGEWRCMEPGGLLPFWKPKKERTKRIMVHEGPKVARYIENLVTSDDPATRAALAAHPFGATFKEYEHWGIIGGALAPQRADYAELHAVSPIEVIYVCDNDRPGKTVLPRFSEYYGRAVKGVMFEKEWPHGWDAADPVPDRFFRNGRYIGTSFRQLMKPATFATELRPNPKGTGRNITIIRETFISEWLHCSSPECYVHNEWPSEIKTSAQFNNEVRPYSHVDDTARLVRQDAASKSTTLKYDPSCAPGLYSRKSQRFINTHVPSDIVAEDGDAAPWLGFLEMLIPDKDDRKEVMRWCATLIARPAIKMHYGLLLISETQGVGKSTLGEKMLAPLVGWENTSVPSESQIVDSEYNYWIAHKRLAVVHEIYAGHSSKGYDRLKSAITDRFITVSRKYWDNYEIENWLHIFACSNSLRALKLDDDDRRWFVPGVGGDKRTTSYWEGLNTWLTDEGGLAIIKGWAVGWLRKNKAVMTGDSAPSSQFKNTVIEEGRSPGQNLVAMVLKFLMEEYGDKPIVILDTALVDLIRHILYEGRFNERLEKPRTVRKIALALGWHVSKAKVRCPAWGVLVAYPRLITNRKELAERLPSALAKEGVFPFDLNGIIDRIGR
jgi:hypothetical protein